MSNSATGVPIAGADAPAFMRYLAFLLVDRLCRLRARFTRSDPQKFDCIPAIVLWHHIGIKQRKPALTNELAICIRVEVAEEHGLPEVKPVLESAIGQIDRP